MISIAPNSAVPSATTRHRHRFAAISVVAAVLLIATGDVTYRRLTHPARIRQYARSLVEREWNVALAVEDASFSLLDGIRLTDVRVRLPDLEAKQAAEAVDAALPLLGCRELRLQVGWLGWLRGANPVQSVIAVEPTCTLDLAGDAIDQLEKVIREWSARRPSKPAWETLPAFELRRATLRVLDPGFVDGAHRLCVTVRALPSPQNPRRYDVVWRDESDASVEGHIQIDLDGPSVRTLRGGSPWLAGEMLVALARGQSEAVRERIVPLGLHGQGRVVDAAWYPQPPGASGSHATFEFRDASLSIPVNEEEQALPATQRFLRFRQVSGRAEWSPGELRSWASGVLHDARCELEATVHLPAGPLRTIRYPAYEWQASVRGITLPALVEAPADPASRFIRRWPPLAAFYQDYAPRGLVDLGLDVARGAGLDSRIWIRRLDVMARGVEIVHAKLPYRLDSIEGPVRYTPDGVTVGELQGRHGDALFSARGDLMPGPPLSGRLEIRGQAVSLDGDFWEALPAGVGRVREALDSHGAVDVAIAFSQPQTSPGMPHPWQWEAEAELRQVTIRPATFPYPLENLSGVVAITPERAHFKDILGRSGEAPVWATGEVAFDADGLISGEVKVSARDLRPEERLISALPSPMREQVAAAEPDGPCDVAVTSTWDHDQAAWSHTVDVDLHDISIRHEAFPLPLAGVLGHIRVSPEQIRIQGVTGRHEDSTWSIDGTVAAVGDAPLVSLQVRGQNVRLTPQLRAALPAGVRATLADWTIDGPAETTTTATGSARNADGRRVQTEVHVRGATVSHAAHGVPLRDVHADVTTDGSHVEVHAARARFGGALVRIDGTAEMTPDGFLARGSLAASGLRLDAAARSLLPSRLQGEWDRLEPGGTVDLYLDDVQMEKKGTEPAVWNVAGRTDLIDVSLGGSAQLHHLSGAMDGRGRLFHPSAGIALEGSVRLSSAELLDRRLERVDGRWAVARDPGGDTRLAIRSAQGRVYDGRVMGEAEFTFSDRETRYQASAAVHRMQIKPFIDAATPHAEPTNVTGYVNGQLFLNGTVGDDATRRGGGRFEIVEGHIHQLPILLAIIQVLNLSIPEQNVFDEASVAFFINGRRIDFEDIRVHSGRLSLVGSGSMSVLDHGVDLTFVQVNNPRWAVVPGVKELLHAATRDLLEIRATGPLHRPNVRAAPFSGLREEVKGLFQPKKPPTPPGGR